MATAEWLTVELVYSPASGQVELSTLTLPAGSTLLDAIKGGGVLAKHPELSLESLSVGVWGAARKLGDPLRERDRVEIYRPLLVDPKEARRLRHRRHRAKAGR